MPLQWKEMKVLILVVLVLALGLVWLGFAAEQNWHNAHHYALRKLDHAEARE